MFDLFKKLNLDYTKTSSIVVLKILWNPSGAIERLVTGATNVTVT